MWYRFKRFVTVLPLTIRAAWLLMQLRALRRWARIKIWLFQHGYIGQCIGEWQGEQCQGMRGHKGPHAGPWHRHRTYIHNLTRLRWQTVPGPAGVRAWKEDAQSGGRMP